MTELLTDLEALARFRDALSPESTVGLIPTMGALHEGHLSLVRRAASECDHALVTIFVNPLQFGPGEDLDQYPRNLEQDRRLLEGVAARAIFAPTPNLLYPAGFATYVTQSGPAGPLEGACRPGHFRGVLTVVLKLLLLTRPHVAYFGQKDYQQTVVIQRMVRDLHLPVKLEVCPIIREADGLALSSRNVYLSRERRPQALALYRGLQAAQALFGAGETRPGAIRGVVEQVLTEADVHIDYVQVADPHTLRAATQAEAGTAVLIAARVGETRLIDNHILGDPL